MCGISGFLGNKEAFTNILKGLLLLQNRGYDSAGICTIAKGDNLVLTKYASKKTQTALDILPADQAVHNGNTTGIGHTRWATHGAKTDLNSHPHIDHTNKIALAHNGIIENYYDLKQELIDTGIEFKSQTDTEVIVNLISFYYQQHGHIEEAIVEATSRLQGTWGLVAICTDKPDNLYCARHGSPLLIGFGGDFMMVASEQTGFAGYVNNYICLDDGDVVVLKRRDDKIFFEKKEKYKIKDVTIKDITLTPEPYDHWTIKEINEQYDSSIRAISLGGRLIDDNKVKLGGLQQNINTLKEIDHLILLGCGTSLHSGLHALHYFKDLCDFCTVQAFDGAEFNCMDIPKVGSSALIFLSQSGETKDLYRCIEIGKDNDLFMIGVVNTVDSLIAREVDCGCYLHAGREVGVASTKAFTSQVIVLSIIAIWFSQIKESNLNKRKRYLKDLHQLPQAIRRTIQHTTEQCKEIAKYLFDKTDCYILGKSHMIPIAMEGTLKLKEIGYIHCEACGGNSLRHGPYALLEKGTPVMFINPDDSNFSSMCNTIEEVNSREADPICITNTNKDILHSKFTVIVENNETYKGILHNIPMQLISYYLALEKGHNPDFPRNLAKCVSV